MIYVSSSCVPARTIGEAVAKLVEEGYSHIELSGGTQPYPGLEEELLRLKSQHNLSYLCHNYFPPPAVSFVVNLASLDSEISELRIQHVERALELSRKLGADKFAVHAGFLMDIPLAEIGKSIQQRPLFDREKAMDQFITNLNALKAKAGEIALYVENNVVSAVNLKNFQGTNPLFVTSSVEFRDFRTKCEVGLLLDVAHLKVSSHSLGLDFERELDLIDQTDYVHISDNDGLTDNNRKFEQNSKLWTQLSRKNLKGKTFTLEVYTGLDDLRSSYEALRAII